MLRLNAFQLVNLGAVRILWTNKISRHLLLSNHAQKVYLELFAMPSVCDGAPASVLKCAGIPIDLMDEIRQSYANLFNPQSRSKMHVYFGSLVGLRFWCRCLSCSSRRISDAQLKQLESESFKSEDIMLTDSISPGYDAYLGTLMRSEAQNWNHTVFKQFWPRVLALDAHLSNSKPWNFWVIFRDRRDSVQFWTFL